MRKFYFTGLKYGGLNNLGDNIQWIAVERLLPSIEQRFNRDTLALASPTSISFEEKKAEMINEFNALINTSYIDDFIS